MANKRKNTTTVLGNRVGSTKFLLKSAEEGWVVKAGPGDGWPVRYDPRTKYDPVPFTTYRAGDPHFRYGSRECWAEVPETAK